MLHLLEFNLFSGSTTPGSAPAGSEVAPPIFGTIDFSMSNVSDDAMSLIAGLMAQSVINSGEAEKIVMMAKNNPNSAASYLQNKIEGILSQVPGTKPEFIQQVKGQGSNLAKYMIQIIPGLLGNLSDQDVDAHELKQDPSKVSFFDRLEKFITPEQ
jgi:hypothetical protein